MTLLLDSHTVLWWIAGSKILPMGLTNQIEDPSNEILVSSVTFYELHYKAYRSRLPIDADALSKSLESSGFQHLPILPRHAVAAAQLQWHHRDPWDRVLAAQAQLENCQLASRDSVFDTLDIERVWK